MLGGAPILKGLEPLILETQLLQHAAGCLVARTDVGEHTIDPTLLEDPVEAGASRL